MERVYQPLVLPPGFAKTTTEVYHEGRWVDGSLARSIGGIIETVGGWERFESGITLTGAARSVIAWRALDDKKHLAFGTFCKLYHLEVGSTTIDDITPVRDSGTLGNDPLTTVSGSAIVTVAHTSHGALEGTSVTYGGAAAVGGITIDGTYTISKNIDANSYEITHSSAASSSATGGGASVTYSYEINCGLEDSADGFGFGVGVFGASTFGTPRTTTDTGGILLRCRTWTLWNYGEDLLACPWDANIYTYDTSAGGVATLLANAPTTNVGIFVTPERIVVALGASDNRLSVATSDITSNTVWTPASSNQATTYQLQSGSELLGGRPLRGGSNMLWTDVDAILQTYLGRSPWWSYRSQGGGTGLIGPLAHAELDGDAYWMGRDAFQMFDGFTREMPRQEDVKSYIFDKDVNTNAKAIDFKQRHKTVAFRLPQFREIWWLYQSVDSTDDVNRYVMFNIDEQVWYTGPLLRSCYTDALMLDYPIAVAPTGEIYEHEKGTDDDSAALEKKIRSSYLDIGDGERNMEILGLYSDFQNQAGDVTLNLYTRDAPQGTVRTEGPYTLSTTSELVDTRAAGKFVSVEFVSNVIGGKFRMGAPRLMLRAAGDRW